MRKVDMKLAEIYDIESSIRFFEDRIKGLEESEESLLFEYFIRDGEPPIMMEIPKEQVIARQREALVSLYDKFNRAKLEAIEEFHRLEKVWTSTGL